MVHDNLAIYLVRGKSAAGPVPLTLDEALAKSAVKVHETGNVNELQVENLGSDEVFVQSGDIVKGGQQDRVLTVSLILPPKSGRIPIASFCVEQGRWSARGKEDVKTFATASAVVPSREAKIAMKAPVAAFAEPTRTTGISSGSIRTTAAVPSETGTRQQEVWRKVRKVQDGLSSNLGTTVNAAASQSSLQLALENEKLKDAQAAYLTALQGAGEKENDIVGYIFAINGKLNSAEVYPSNGLFRKMWPKLLQASITEAIGQKNADNDAAPTERGRVGVPQRSRDRQGERETASGAGAARRARRRQGVLFRNASRQRCLGASQLSGEVAAGTWLEAHRGCPRWAFTIRKHNLRKAYRCRRHLLRPWLGSRVEA